MLVHAVIPDPEPQSATDAATEADGDRVRLASRGDTGAFEQLYRQHHRRIYAVLWRLTGGQTARAEDLLQDTFIRAWQALPTFRFESAFSTWLHRLAVNTALMELRSRRNAEDLEVDDEPLLAHASGDTTHREVLQRDLERAVATLPPRARAVLVLFDIEGWTHEEIGAELGMAVGSSKAQLHRARQLLRRTLGEIGHD